MNSSASRVLAIAVGGLVLLAVVAAVLASLRPPPQMAPGSPEATVQSYISAVLASNSPEATAHLDPEGPCASSDLPGSGYYERDVRVILRDSTVTASGNEATVRVDLVQGNQSPFGGDEWATSRSFSLRKAAAGWVITGRPWPMISCDEVAP